MRYALAMPRIGCALLLLLLAPFADVEAQGELNLSADGTLRRLRLPILMYHYISPIPPDADSYRRELTVEPEFFTAHMDYLAKNGYTTVTLRDLYNALAAGLAFPAKPIILTFDDGYRDHYEYALPILLEYGFLATFFIITGHVDEENPAHLNWTQIAAMKAGGMAMESHSKHHRDLREKDFDFLVYEMLGSYETLRAKLGEPPLTFSYPSGLYDENAVSVLTSTPYRFAVTTEAGSWHTMDDLLTLKRLRVYGNMPVANLAVMLNPP